MSRCTAPGCPGPGSLAHEFPEFREEWMPQVPSWLRPEHWHNEVCPHWSDGANQADSESGIVLWVDHPDPAARELPGARRYTVWWGTGVVPGGMEDSFSTDDWLEALRMLHWLAPRAEECVR